MARLPRLAFAGYPHHVLQRGHSARPVFIDDDDRRSYLDALREVARHERVAIHGYALRAAEVQLLATPATDDGLSRLMQALGRRHGMRFNRRHGHVGTLWAGRFCACAVEAESWLLLCLRSIERPADEYSSVWHHLGRRRDSLISEHPAYWALGNTPFEREATWDRLLEHALTDTEVEAITAAVRRGWPLGGERFRVELEARAGRILAARPVGRPLRQNYSVPK